MKLAKPLLEKIAELEHEQWMTWAKSILEKEKGISPERVTRWWNLFIPYDRLSEKDKEQDRIWARKVLAVLPVEAKERKERESIAQDVLECTSEIAFIIQNATFVNESDALRLKKVERKLETLEALLRAGSEAKQL